MLEPTQRGSVDTTCSTPTGRTDVETVLEERQAMENVALGIAALVVSVLLIFGAAILASLWMTSRPRSKKPKGRH